MDLHLFLHPRFHLLPALAVTPPTSHPPFLLRFYFYGLNWFNPFTVSEIVGNIRRILGVCLFIDLSENRKGNIYQKGGSVSIIIFLYILFLIYFFSFFFYLGEEK